MKTKTIVLAIVIPVVAVILLVMIASSLVLYHVATARKKAAIAVAMTNVVSLNTALEQYVQETGKYPGDKVEETENAIPELFEALFGEKPPRGKGGPHAPYMRFRDSDVLVRDESSGSLRPAAPEDISDPKVGKYLADPWGRPYVYRANLSRLPKPWMRHPKGADIYSLGPDGIDGTIDGEPGDDIGNW